MYVPERTPLENSSEFNLSVTDLTRTSPIRAGVEEMRVLSPSESTAFDAAMSNHGFDRSVAYEHPVLGARSAQLGHPITLEASLRAELGEALTMTFRTIQEMYRDKEVLAQVSRENSPIFNGKPLVTDDYIEDRHPRFLTGVVPPLAYDVILCVDNQGQLCLRAVEVQTTTGYLSGDAMISAAKDAGIVDDSFSNTPFATTQAEAVSALRQIANSPTIAVVDVDPLTAGSDFDLFYMARAIGRPDSVPLNLRNIASEVDNNGARRWYIPEETYGADGSVVVTDKRVYLDAVLLRSTQLELECLEKSLSGNSEQLEAISEFLTDYREINFLQTTADMHLLSKETMVDLLREPFAATDFSISRHFLDVYQSGDTPAPGQYALKRIAGNSGKGVYLVEFGDGDSPNLWDDMSAQWEAAEGYFRISYGPANTIPVELRVDRYYPLGSIVPDGFTAQGRMQPARLCLTGDSVDGISEKLDMQLEIRCMSCIPQLFGGDNAAPYAQFFARPAPFESNGGIVKTNVGEAMRAVDAFVESLINAQVVGQEEAKQLVKAIPHGLSPAGGFNEC